MAYRVKSDIRDLKIKFNSEVHKIADEKFEKFKEVNK
jgi:hypothetical protein